MELVTHDSLFDEFARAVCHAGVVAKKEVFETWASALYIHSAFLMDGNVESHKKTKKSCIKRVADIAAGHGLLAWALLILDDERQPRTCPARNRTEPLTAFCLDVRMPPSAESIRSSMIQRWPHLEHRFDYVEGRLEQIVPHPSCLLASVHACGTLSDVLVATAAEKSVPLAVVPCCHSRKRKVLEDVASRSFAKNEYDVIIDSKGKIPDLADRLDEARMAALENAGLDVEEVFLPKIFTGKNRLILGFPTAAASHGPLLTSDTSPESTQQKSTVRKGQMPSLSLDDTVPDMVNPKARFLKGFYVPCEDNEPNRSLVSKLSGRAAANDRKAAMHNRNHTDVPQFDLSLWLPPKPPTKLDEGRDDRVDLTENALVAVVESNHPNVECMAFQLGSVYVDPKTGREAQTFRIQYRKSVRSYDGDKNEDESDGDRLSLDDARWIHKQLYQIIPAIFHGAECR